MSTTLKKQQGRPLGKRLTAQLDRFLAQRRRSNGGWAPVTRDDLQQLDRIIDLLIETKWGPDEDGDRPVEFRLIDRTRYEPEFWLRVPYTIHVETPEQFDECLRAVLANLGTAAQQAGRLADMRRYLKEKKHG